MTNTIKKTKEDFGYSEDLKDFYFQTNSSSQKGSFHTQIRKKDYYWYFLLSSGKNSKKRFKYLCKTFEGKNSEGQTSFQYCLKVLSEKQLEDFKPRIQSNMRIGRLFEEFQGVLLKEEQSDEGRMYESTRSLINSMLRFSDFCKIEDVRFSDIENGRSLKTLIIDYIDFCKKRGLTRNTIKTYLKGVRQFLIWLCDEDIGKGVMSSHPITSEFIKKVFPLRRKDKKSITDRNVFYKHEFYTKMFNVCLHKVGDLWNEFCKIGHQKKSRFHTIGVSSDVTYFISLFQLHSGFRLGEVLTSYRNREYWLNRKDKKNSSTYWENRDGNWFLYLEDFKGRDGIVPVKLHIKSWTKPPCDHKVIKDKKGEVISYDTDLVEVCKNMFRKSSYLFSSSNLNTHTERHISKSHYSNIFKSNMVVGEGFEGYGVNSSHNLRSYFITRMIEDGHDIMDLCEITRHNVNTMLKYYKRFSETSQIKRQTRMDKSRVIKKRSDIPIKDKGS